MKKTIIFKNVTLDEVHDARRKNNAVMDFLEAFLDSGQIAIEFDYAASGYKNSKSLVNALYVAATRLHAQNAVTITRRDDRVFLINDLLRK
jgi:hypothetical protein